MMDEVPDGENFVLYLRIYGDSPSLHNIRNYSAQGSATVGICPEEGRFSESLWMVEETIYLSGQYDALFAYSDTGPIIGGKHRASNRYQEGCISVT